jgi:hypothetical protein
MPAGRRLPLLFLVCLLLCACRNNHNQLLENELRAKESLYRDALHDLKRIEAQNEALVRELAATRQHGGPPLPPEIAAPTFGLKRITLGRGTGGYDSDGLPGDEALQVIVEPRDSDDHIVKVPGSLHISALEVDAQGLKVPLCWWSLTPEQVRPLWKQNLFSSGYTAILPWTAFPHSCNVRIVVQFKIADGRVFEVDRDLKVRPLTSAPLTPAARAAPAAPAAPAPTMPMPTPVHPGPTPSFVVPSALQWVPAPLTDAVELSRPLPIPE